jgi:hypothetical protein
VPARSTLSSAACVLAIGLTSCAARSREPAAPAAPAAASSAVARAPTLRGAEKAEAPREPIQPRDADPKQMRDRVDHLLELVAALAPEGDWPAARQKTVGALRALADAVDVAPAPFDRARVAELAASIRSEAARLASAGYPSLERSDFAKAGLLAATRALDELTAPPEGSLLARLLANAGAAARAIDVNSPFSFERAQIQDAFRATADALLALSLADRPVGSIIGRR